MWTRTKYRLAVESTRTHWIGWQSKPGERQHSGPTITGTRAGTGSSPRCVREDIAEGTCH